MPLSSTLRAAALVVTLGTLVQGSIGYGMTLVAAPLLSLVDPTLVPVPLILLTPVHAVLRWPGTVGMPTGLESAGRR
ncbi:MAG TPA: hypothetical protein VF788_18710 [Pseudonocardiaceae bacterium]